MIMTTTAARGGGYALERRVALWGFPSRSTTRAATPRCAMCALHRARAFICRYRALASYSKEEVCIAFMRVLRGLPYGNATFFTVRRIGEAAASHLLSATPAAGPSADVWVTPHMSGLHHALYAYLI